MAHISVVSVHAHWFRDENVMVEAMANGNGSCHGIEEAELRKGAREVARSRYGPQSHVYMTHL